MHPPPGVSGTTPGGRRHRAQRQRRLRMMGHNPTDQIRTIRREITLQEREWISAILRSHTDWSNIGVGELDAIGECTCGCRSIMLDLSRSPRNPKWQDLTSAVVGDIYIQTDDDKSIEIILHAQNGVLQELAVICNANSEPVPAAWREVARYIYTGGSGQRSQ